MKSRKYSLWSIVLIFAFIISIFFYFDLWKKNRIVIDAPSYYAYLPATFIYNDLHLNFIDKNPQFFKDKIWYYKVEQDKKLIKCTAGVSMLLLPFFTAGHIVAGWVNASPDGYSMPYQNAMSIGVLIYLLAGLLYLRKILLEDFSESITALTLTAIVLGTNLLWYSTFEGFMSHAISFSLLCGCMYTFKRWLQKDQNKYLLVFAFLFGLICLIRPLAITILLYFFIIAMYSKGGMKPLMQFLKARLKVIFKAAIIFILILFIQSCYWKYSTGHWFFDVYIDEHFVFDSPQMFLFLFSFRKGVFVYTPILIFAVIGLIVLFRKNRAVFYATSLLMAITILILSSWWAWSYGICWGMRPMIDYYSILAIPLAAGFQYVFSKGRIIKIVSSILIFGLILLNLFQTWQYKNGLIHYDDMTREAYFKGFFQTQTSLEWQDLLKPYNWDRRINHLSQIEYSKEYFEKNYGKNNMYLRGYNIQYVGVNSRAQNAVASYMKGVAGNAIYTIQQVNGDTICLRAFNGNFLSVSQQYDNVLIANAIIPGASEKFVISYIENGDNKITLKAANGNFITVNDQFPNMLSATAKEVSQKEIFRLYVNE